MYKEFWEFYITDNGHVNALYAFKIDTVWNEGVQGYNDTR
jgi:hypothetical protein